MSAVSLDIDFLSQWIGREEVVTAHLSADLVTKFRAMLGQPAGELGSGAAAPRLIHFCLGQPAIAPSGLGPDGHPARGGFLPPIALPRRMWAGGELRFLGDLCIGDAVEKRSLIANIEMKEGRTGRLCFVTVQHRLTARGRIKIEERQDIVYREEAAGAATKMPPPAPRGRFSRPIDTSTTTLFRYSALTFNGHRIHYDRRYAMQIEGYRGLVVHGPLQASLLHDFAAELAGRAPARFGFRGQAPLIDDDESEMHAEPGDDGMRLWTAPKNGPIAMSAQAYWD